MPNETNVKEKSNDNMPADKLVRNDKIASDDRDLLNEAQANANEPEDNFKDESDLEAPIQGDPENQAGSDGVDRDKFRRG